VTDFGPLLRGYREQAGYTQCELAVLARISVRGLRYLERGATSPNPRAVRRLASALSLTPRREASLVAAANGARRQSAGRAKEEVPKRVGPARTPWTGPGDLPGQFTNFIGREATLTLASRRLAADRLVSLVGAGGCGKTRIAIEVGRRARAARPDGVFFADLSGLSDPILVPGALLRALRLREVPGREATDVLISFVAGRDLLIVLDNCEHLVEACAGLVHALVANCPRVWVLATSRQSLRIPGETVIVVDGLALPDGVVPGEVRWLEGSEAGALFVDRARRASSRFNLDNASALLVADICQRLDGMPLALELAAARARVMSVQKISDGLSDRFRLLVDGGRSRPGRHETLLACIEWSRGLLREDERLLLRRLSVFTSGFSLPGAEAVCSGVGIDRAAVFGLLTSLVDKSLVQAQPEADRFRLHESMRAHGLAELDSSGETTAVRDRHLEYCGVLAEEVGPQSWTSELPSAAVALAFDLDNIRAALDWCLESKQYDTGAKLIWDLGHFFSAGLQSEFSRRCERLLAAKLDPLSRARLLFFAAHYTFYTSPNATLRLASELVAQGRSLGDRSMVGHGLSLMALVQMIAQPEEAIRNIDEAIPLVLEAGPAHLYADLLDFKSQSYIELGRPEDAFECAEEAVRAGEEADWLWGTVLARARLAIAAVSTGRLARALEEAELILALGTELSDHLLVVCAENIRGDVARIRGEAGAREAFEHARAVAEASGDIVNLAWAEAMLGYLQVSLGLFDGGYEMLKAATARAEALGFPSVNNQAHMAELAARRGDLDIARHHLAACSKLSAGSTHARAALTWRAAARLARAENQPQKALGLACDALLAAFSSGAVLLSVDLLEVIVTLLLDLGRNEVAVRILGAVDRQRELTGYVRSGLGGVELMPLLAGIETTLGRDAFERARAEGGTLSPERAVSYARRGRARRGEGVSGWGSLTPSERQVASLVACRLTNAEIAEQLFVSTRTVKSHLTRVFVKLQVSNRRELAVAARGRTDNIATAAPDLG
jgi:predicted ATPase/DNA-binding CsgD family transcriptional regulator/transcriptional regulator with XRE-family HTH domain